MSVGDAARMTCEGANLLVSDLVWQIYPLGQPLSTTVIFLTGRQVVFDTVNMKNNNTDTAETSRGMFGSSSSNSDYVKYQVVAEQVKPNSVRSTLTISNVNWTDGEYAYQCACNIYTACANGRKVNAVARLNVTARRQSKSQSSSSSKIILIDINWDRVFVSILI